MVLSVVGEVGKGRGVRSEEVLLYPTFYGSKEKIKIFIIYESYLGILLYFVLFFTLSTRVVY